MNFFPIYQPVNNLPYLSKLAEAASIIIFDQCLFKMLFSSTKHWNVPYKINWQLPPQLTLHPNVLFGIDIRPAFCTVFHDSEVRILCMWRRFQISNISLTSNLSRACKHQSFWSHRFGFFGYSWQITSNSICKLADVFMGHIILIWISTP